MINIGHRHKALCRGDGRAYLRHEFGINGQWLLDKNGEPGFQQAERHRQVQRCWRANHRSIEMRVGQCRLKRVKAWGRITLLHGREQRGALIAGRNRATTGLLETAKMPLADAAAANDEYGMHVSH